MSNMRLYHYTNIETLALILKNKTIRFNRLDCVDDLEEGYTESSGIKPGLYTFVSCWTENPEESIPLWKMYTDKGVGIRIGLDKDMFKKYTFRNGEIINGTRIYTDTTHQKPIAPYKIAQDDYWILPNFNDGVFFKVVKYVPNVEAAMENAKAVRRTGEHINQLQISKWGLYKSDRWSFQQESRFTLIIFPKSKAISLDNPVLSEWLQDALIKGVTAPFTYFDMKLDECALNSIEITLCPNISEGNKTIVESLCRTFLGDIKPIDSSLSGCIKLK